MAAGSIVIDMLMRTGGFETDAKRAEKSLRRMEIQAIAVGNALGRFLADGITAIARSIPAVINNMDEMSKAAQRSNISTELFSSLAYAAALADIEVNDITKSMGRLAKSQGDAAKGLKAQTEGFAALGIEFKNADGSLRDTYEVFLDFADVFQKHKGSPEVMALGMEVFGKSFQKFIPLFKDGKAGIEAAVDEAKRFGVTVSTEAGHAAEQFNDDLVRLTSAAKGLATQVAADLLPDLNNIVGGFEDAATAGSNVADTAKSIADAIRVVMGVVEVAANIFTFLTRKLDDTILGFYGLHEAAKGVINLNWDQVRRGVGLAAEGAGGALLGRPTVVTPGNRVLSSTSTGGTGQFANVNTPGTVDPLTIDPPDPSGGSGKSEAEKAAESLERAYQSLNERLHEQITLHGQTGEAAKVRYEIEHGALSQLDSAKAAMLLKDAEHLDLLDEIAEHEQIVAEIARQVAEEQQRRTERRQDVLDTIRDEIELVQMSAEAQEVWNNLKWAGVDAESSWGKEIAAATEELQRQREIQNDQIEVMDGLRDSAKGFLDDLREGVGVWDALKSAADNFADVLFELAARKIIEQLFGQQGQSGGGSSGDAIGGFLGAIFGGARAGGGDVMSGRAYLVGEQGPEMFVPRTSGTVVPSNETRRAMGGGNSVSQYNQFSFAAPTSNKTQAQMANRTAFELGRARRLTA
jgi:hypothetical protein